MSAPLMRKAQLLHEALLYCSIVTICITLISFNLAENLERKSLDWRFRLRGPQAVHPDLALVDISDDAIEQFGQWPFPRQFHAMFLDAATRLGAEQIVYDIFFSKGTNPAVDAMLGNIAEETHNTYFPLKFSTNSTARAKPDPQGNWRRFALPFRIPKNEKRIFRASALQDPPVASISRAAMGMGFINTVHDPDGVSRRTPALIALGDSAYLNLGLAAAVGRWLVNPKDIEWTPGEKIIFRKAHVGDKILDVKIPLDEDGNILVNWVGGWRDIPHYSFRDILLSYKLLSEGKKPIMSQRELESLAGKTLVVGLTERGSHDYYPMPFDKAYFLPGLQLNLLHTVLSRKFLNRASPPWRLIISGLFAFVIFLFIRFFPAKWVLTVFPLGATIILTLSTSYFLYSSYWMETAGPLMTCLFGWGGVVLFRYERTLHSNQTLRTTFERYVTHDVMEQLLTEQTAMTLGSKKRDVTILFADIRGFTSLMETHSDEEVVKQLNEYLSLMTGIIFEHKGTIDKFVGDEIMAYFGAPLNPDKHPERALATALEMQKKTAELSTRWKKQGRPPFHIGVGVHTGNVLMGNVGSEKYSDFTLIGDSVNLASRLCSNALPNEVLISAETHARVKEQVEAIVGRDILVKGKKEAVKVYSLVGLDQLRLDQRKTRKSVLIKAVFFSANSELPLCRDTVQLDANGLLCPPDSPMKPGREGSVDLEWEEKSLLKNLHGRTVMARENVGTGTQVYFRFTGVTEAQQNAILDLVYRKLAHLEKSKEQIS